MSKIIIIREMTFEVASFVGSFFSGGWLLFTAVNFIASFEGSLFRRVVTFGIHCETSHANDFVNAKSNAREKPLLAGYSDQFGIACYFYHFP